MKIWHKDIFQTRKGLASKQKPTIEIDVKLTCEKAAEECYFFPNCRIHIVSVKKHKSVWQQYEQAIFQIATHLGVFLKVTKSCQNYFLFSFRVIPAQLQLLLLIWCKRRISLLLKLWCWWENPEKWNLMSGFLGNWVIWIIS